MRLLIDAQILVWAFTKPGSLSRHSTTLLWRLKASAGD
jgi:hypothetical protein